MAGRVFPSSLCNLPKPTWVTNAKPDRYNGLSVRITQQDLPHTPNPEHAHHQLLRAQIENALARWRDEEIHGVWLMLDADAADATSTVIQTGFAIHHAKPDYICFSIWLPDGLPNSLPTYAFTQIGVGGVVVDADERVLLVKERTSAVEQYQGTWKLPGGINEPGENFADTAIREVHEETGVVSAFVGVVSMRHGHGFLFGQDDLYVVCKLSVVSAELAIDNSEIAEARWFSLDELEPLVATDCSRDSFSGLVTKRNMGVIRAALEGRLIDGVATTRSSGPAWVEYKLRGKRSSSASRSASHRVSRGDSFGSGVI